jgi:phosphate starvation-inducible PhoH-like protein
MKMFLTRMGLDSQAVITGDITQTDLPGGQLSGLRDARNVLSRIDGIAFCHFDERDVVRHPLVRDIIGAYAQAESPEEPDMRAARGPEPTARDRVSDTPSRTSRPPARGERTGGAEPKSAAGKIEGEAE